MFGVDELEWPSQNPNLNPTQPQLSYLWDELEFAPDLHIQHQILNSQMLFWLNGHKFRDLELPTKTLGEAFSKEQGLLYLQIGGLFLIRTSLVPG